MRRILDFLYKYRVAAYFLFLESLCIILLLSTNSFYGASFFNSSNALSGSVQTLGNNSADYFRLKNINEDLAIENAWLREQLANTIASQLPTNNKRSDFAVIPARVVNNTYRRTTNYLTIATGKSQGIKANMGVLSGNGIIGRVLSCSERFCTVASILNPSTLTSVEIKRTGTLCTAQWQNLDFRKISIRYIPRHIDVFKGDTIVTSGYNTIYPPGVMVGIVDSVTLTPESPFYFVEAELSTDFSSIDYAYIVNNERREEIDSLAIETVEAL